MKTKEQTTAERAKYKEAVKKRGFTLIEVANMLGVKQSTLSAMLTRGVSAGLAARTAAVLGCSPSDLLPSAPPAAKQMAATDGQRVTFTFICPDCGKAHTLSISID